MYKTLSILLAGLALTALAGPESRAEDLRVLFLSKSSGYEHKVIARVETVPSHVETVLTMLAQDKGWAIHCTKNAGEINGDNLKNYDVVILYTTGELTEPGTDKNPPMDPDGVAALEAWVRQGGGLIGYHSATDTFRRKDGSEIHPFVTLIGAEFLTHGQKFSGIVKTVDAKHPTMAHVPQDWLVYDEWYMFHKMNTGKLHVLAMLDPAAERQKQETYNVPDYPIVWCMALDKGRVYYNALGHMPEVWLNPAFQESVMDAVRWAAGQGRAGAEPNYDTVVKPHAEGSH